MANWCDQLEQVKLARGTFSLNQENPDCADSYLNDWESLAEFHQTSVSVTVPLDMNRSSDRHVKHQCKLFSMSFSVRQL